MILAVSKNIKESSTDIAMAVLFVAIFGISDGVSMPTKSCA